MARQPTDAEIIRQAIDSRMLDLHTALPGVVKKYDPAKQVADVMPVVRRAAPTSAGGIKLEDLPVIQNVPVAWPRGGGYSLQFPLDVGDHVLLVFNEAAIGQWRASGQVSQPGDLRRHDLSYPYAIPCGAPDADALEAIDGDEAVLDGPTQIRLGGSGAEFVALATLVAAQLDDLKSAFNAWTPVPMDGGAALKTLLATFSGSSTDVAATKVKAE